MLIVLGIFLPSYIIPIIGHDLLHILIENTFVEPFLDGVAASVIGLLLQTAFQFLKGAVISGLDATVFGLAFYGLFYFTNQFTQPIMILVAAITGQILYI